MKKQKTQKYVLKKRKLTFENYKNYSEASQRDNEKNYREKNKNNTDGLKKSKRIHKEQ